MFSLACHALAHLLLVLPFGRREWPLDIEICDRRNILISLRFCVGIYISDFQELVLDSLIGFQCSSSFRLDTEHGGLAA